MKKIALILTLSLLGPIACAPRTLDLELNKWTALGEAKWQTETGVTSSATAGGISYLVSTKKYQNYILELDFFPTAEVNSGVFVACKDARTIDATLCHEVNIWDDHPRQEFRTGAIVTKVFPPEVQVQTNGMWNHYRIVVKNGGVLVKLNGQTTAQLKQSDLAEGYIALQKAEGGEIRFKNIKLTPLRP